jgi:hypothetical protein
VIQHIVLFTPKASIPEHVRTEFAGLVRRTLSGSPHVTRFTIGARVDVDAGYQRSFGDATYDFAAVIEFESRDRLVAYLTDPDHLRLGEAFWQYSERCVVCEVEVSEQQRDS